MGRGDGRPTGASGRRGAAHCHRPWRHTGYPSGSAYAQAVAGSARDTWSWDGLLPASTAVVPDVMMGIVEVLHLVSSPGDAVIVCPPVYARFYAFTSNAGRRIVERPLTEGGRLDLSALETTFDRVRSESRRPVLLLSNPHNPTGVVHTSEELRSVASLARAFGVRVISDEIHAPLVLEGAEFTPYLSVPGSEDAFALFSASKGWNLAGLKAALLVAGAEALNDLERLPEVVSHGPSHLGVIAHTAAFEGGRGWHTDLLEALQENRLFLRDLVEGHQPAVRMHWPEATYLAWLDCRDLGTSAAAPSVDIRAVSEVSGPAARFLERGRVALSSGHVFGAGGEGFVRLNFATSRAILEEAIVRMSRAI